MGIKNGSIASTLVKHKVALLIPAYNEECHIGSVVLKARNLVDRIIVVDDGSDDATADIARAAGAIVVCLKENMGKGVALCAGFKKAGELDVDVLVCIDGDGQHLTEEVGLVIEPICLGEADLVIGSRYLEATSNVPQHRIWGHRFFNLITRWSSGTQSSDSQSGFRAFSRAAVELLSFQSNGFSVESEMLYLLALTLAEVVTVMVAAQAGAMIHLILLFMLMVHTAVTWQRPLHRFLMGLIFVPLIRIISISLPLSGFPLVYWYLVTSIPLFAATYVAGRQLGIPLVGRDFQLRGLPLQLAIGASGIILGFIEYIILKPEPLIEGRFDWGLFWLGALILFISTGYIEELIFRRVMQQTSSEALGRIRGIVYVSILFAVLHIGYNSLADIIFVFLVGFAFGLIVLRTGSLLGVTLAHGLTNIVLFLVVPFLVIGELPLLEANSTDIRNWVGQNLAEISPPAGELPTRAIPLTIPTDPGAGVVAESGGLEPTLTASPIRSTPSQEPTPQPAITATRTTTTTVRGASPTAGPPPDQLPFKTGQILTTEFDELNIRLGPDTSYASLGFLEPDQQYDLLDQNDAGDWLLICCYQPSGREGWVSAAYMTGYQDSPESSPIITAAQIISAPVAMAIVSMERLTVRAGPSFDDLILGEQLRGTRFDIIARTADRDWWLICCVEGASGWVNAKSVTISGDPFAIPVFEETVETPTLQPAVQPGTQLESCPPPDAADFGFLSSIGDLFQSLVEIVFPNDDPCQQ